MLEQHLDSGKADAWRPALRVLEHGWGRPPEKIESEPVLEDGDVTKMSTPQLHELVRRRRERRKNAEALALVDDAVASTADAPPADAV